MVTNNIGPMEYNAVSKPPKEWIRIFYNWTNQIIQNLTNPIKKRINIMSISRPNQSISRTIGG